MSKKLLIIGGYGNAGMVLADLLLKHTDAELTIAGRNLEKAESFSRQLNQKYAGERVGYIGIDASDEQSLKPAFEGANMVIVASSTIDYVRNVAQTALKTGTDYFDIQLSSQAKLKVLRELEPEIIKAGLCFITDGGFHPGVPAALVNYAGVRSDRIEVANVYSYINMDFSSLQFSPSTPVELVEEFRDPQLIVYQQGGWRKLKYSKYPVFDFGPGFGKKFCSPMFMGELRELPRMYPSLKETGFYVSGFNNFTSYVAFPLIAIGLKIAPRKAVKPLSKFLEWSLRSFSKPPYITTLVLDARGQKADKMMKIRVAITHPDGYFLTSAPATACIIQYLEGGIRKPGLWYQATVMEPQKLLQDLKKMGIEVEIQESIA
jgi:saccharopine dehydrogenase (NAD+, L-lysine-forming)